MCMCVCVCFHIQILKLITRQTNGKMSIVEINVFKQYDKLPTTQVVKLVLKWNAWGRTYSAYH